MTGEKAADHILNKQPLPRENVGALDRAQLAGKANANGSTWRPCLEGQKEHLGALFAEPKTRLLSRSL